MPPKRLPMVSTFSPNSATNNVATTNATIEPGISASEPDTRGSMPVSSGSVILRFMVCCQPTIIPSDNKATASAAPFQVGSACHSVCISAKNSAGACPSIRSPRKSLICDKPISTAMPLVKPIITATGINLINTPMRKKPISHSITPDINVASSSPPTPYCATMPYTITINAPAGPPICTREPLNSEIRKPAIMAVNKPASGFKPLAIANAIASGSATTLTVKPAPTSLIKRSRL